MLPNLSILWVIALLLLLGFVLDRFLFKPVLQVMEERQRRIQAARDLAHEAVARADAATAELEDKTSAARAEIYRQMDEMRKVAQSRRAEIMAATRNEADAILKDAASRLDADVSEARSRLAKDAEALGQAAAERILGRPVS